MKANSSTGPLILGIDPAELVNDPRENWRGISGGMVYIPESADPEVICAYGVVTQIPANFDGQFQIAPLAAAWKKGSEFRDRLISAGVLDQEAEDISGSADVQHQLSIVRLRDYERALVSVREYLDKGQLVRASDEIAARFSVPWEPPDKWAALERLGYEVSRRIISIPIEDGVQIPQMPTSLDGSEDDWLLGIGCVDGSVYVQQLRQPIHMDGSDLSGVDSYETSRPIYLNYYPSVLKMSVAGKRKILLTGKDNQPARVKFLPGGVLGSWLCINRENSRVSAHLSHPDLEVYSIREESTELFDWIRRGSTSGVSLTPDGIITLHENSSQEKAGNELRLRRRSTADVYIGILVLEHHYEKLLIASLSREGHYVLTDGQLKVIEERDFELQERPAQFYKVSSAGDAHGPIIETGSELVVFHRGRYPISIRGREHAHITASYLFTEFPPTVVIGYDDGVVEIHRENERQYELEQYVAHSGAVLDIKGQEGFGGFFTLGEDGTVHIWLNPMGGPSKSILARQRDIVAACFVDHAATMVTAHKSAQLAFWNISPDTSGPTDILSLFGPEQAKDLRSYCVSGGRLWISSGHKFGGIYTWHATRDSVSRTGHQSSNYPDRDKWRHGEAYWTCDRSSVLILHPSISDDGDTHGLNHRATLVNIALNGVASWSRTELRLGKPVTCSARPDGKEYAIFYEDGLVVRLSSSKRSKRRVIATVATAPEGYDVRKDYRKLQSFKWCSYNTTGNVLVGLANARPRLFLYFLDTKNWFFVDGTGPNDEAFLSGPVALSPSGKIAYVSRSDGNVAAIELSEPEDLTFRLYVAPRSRYAKDYAEGLSLLDVSSDGEMLAAASNETVIVWTINDNEIGKEHRMKANVAQLAFIPGTHRLLLIDISGACWIFDAQTGYRVAEIVANAFPSIAPIFNEHGTIAAVRISESDVNRPSRLMSFPTFHSASQMEEYFETLRTPAQKTSNQ